MKGKKWQPPPAREAAARRFEALKIELMMGILSLVIAIGAFLSGTGLALAGSELGRSVAEYRAADPSAPPITQADVARRDRFWPFHVSLIGEFTPEGRSEPLLQIPGVLVRVNSDQTVRIDWGRRGRHDVPLQLTDVVVRANRIRLGTESKMAPNLILTIGNKLLDTRSDPVAPYDGLRVRPPTAVLCVFADPASGTFASAVEPFRQIASDGRVTTVLFPNGEWKDSRVRRKLRTIGWTVPFVLDRFSRGYTASIAGESTSGPQWLLLTLDGRVLARGDPSGFSAERIATALGSSFHSPLQVP